MKNTYTLSLILWLSIVAQVHGHNNHNTNNLSFIANQSQWHDNVVYKAPLGGLNTLFLEEKGFTFLYFDAQDVADLHDVSQASPAEKDNFCLHAHSYKVNFVNALAANITGLDKNTTYHNYFLGNDKSKWAPNVPLFDGVLYDNLYEGIDLKTYSTEGKFKYDFIVEANADPKQITLKYEGFDRIKIKDNGQLVVSTSVETIYESKPYVYQIIGGQKTSVNCVYTLHNGLVQFDFPEGYDTNYELVIDPILVAATLSGSSVTNYGHCAAFDAAGNVYTGAISFGSGYPTVTGAYQTNFGGGGTDIAISKLTPDGSTLLYATYLGGNGSDYPHSIYVDLNLNTHVYGSSDSNNYPTSATAVQTNNAGGNDIVVTVLNPDGNGVLGSTYVGGSAEDGRNGASTNYGDTYRGEIIADFYGNTYIASCSGSSNFPVTPGAFQSTFLGGGAGWSGEQDGVVVKLNQDLSNIEWATYLGSSTGSDMCYGLRIDQYDNVYVCGAAGGADFPTTGDGVAPVYIGGEHDAFIAYLSSDGSTLLNSTFWGTTQKDVAFFIDIDNVDDVAIYGQSEGTMPIEPASIYSQGGSKQFLASFEPDLSAMKYSTVVGGNFLVPVAFMVDNCGYIYFSGYNASAGLEVSSDALFTTGGFYLGVLEENGNNLFYATYYTGNHVDGGTSRFDPNGVVYQGVCSGGGFNTTADAFAPNQSSGWDIGVFKIDFQAPGVNAVANAGPETSGCVPLEVTFSNLGSSANEYYWDFGDGNISTDEEPTHTYIDSGIFEVMLIASDPNSCNQSDTAYIDVFILENNLTTLQNYSICEGENLTLDVTNAPQATYEWFDGSTEPTYNTLGLAGVYWVETNLFNCLQIDSFVVEYSAAALLDLGPDSTLCAGDNYLLDATNPGATYLWHDGSNNATFSVTESGTYWVAAVIDGCVGTDTVMVNFDSIPVVDLGEDRLICDGEIASFDVSVGGGTGVTYLWQDGSTTPTFSTGESGTYWVTITTDVTACAATDSVQVIAGAPEANLGDDLLICDGEVSVLDVTVADSNATYLWHDGSTNATFTVTESGTHSVTVDVNGCLATSSIEVTVHPPLPVIDLGPDRTLCGNETLLLQVPDDGNVYTWQDGSNGTSFLVNQAGTYSVLISNDCGTVEDEMVCTYEALPNIPNPVLIPTAFTPNNDGMNDLFKPTLNGLVENYRLFVYNRWGQLVFSTTDENVGWDGIFEASAMEIGVYAWLCTATTTDCNGSRDHFLRGNVSLLK